MTGATPRVLGDGRPKLYADKAPMLLQWFHALLGAREVGARVERVMRKLKTLHFYSPTLTSRYRFHIGYDKVIRRKKAGRPMEVADAEQAYALTFIHCARLAYGCMSAGARNRLKSSILDHLSPDRDFRSLNHELFTFATFDALGIRVEFPDLEGVGTYDLLVKDRGGEFEVECKVFTEALGETLSIEDEIGVTEAFCRALDRNPVLRSGQFTFHVHRRLRSTNPEYLLQMFDDFLASKPAEKEYADGVIRFSPKEHWDHMVRTAGKDASLDMLTGEVGGAGNPTFIPFDDRIIVFAIKSQRPSLLRRRAQETLRKAADQFSKTRPAMVWVEICGLGEDGFKELTWHAGSQPSLLDLLSAKLFMSPARRHVTNTMFSVESDGPKSVRAKTNYDIPGYVFGSNVSVFPQPEGDREADVRRPAE